MGMREMELATIRASHVEVIGDWRSRGVVVRLTLPASKNDSSAFGVSRAHRCFCLEQANPMCPAHAVIDQLLLLSRQLPGCFGPDGPSLDLPLFPDGAGLTVAKEAMVASIVYAARLLGVVDLRDGSLRVSGHSLRATGAQGLISLGWRADAVQLQGRWMSEAVVRYTREAALHAPCVFTELAALLMSLSGLTHQPDPPPSSSSPEPPSPSTDQWVQNVRSQPGMFHLASDTPGKARCGWRYSQTGALVPDPPPWHHLCCKQCAPLFYAKLKADSRFSAGGEVDP